MTESNEVETTLEQTDDVTLEEYERWALQDHIETLRSELSSAKIRENQIRSEYHELVQRLGTKSGWWK